MHTAQTTAKIGGLCHCSFYPIKKGHLNLPRYRLHLIFNMCAVVFCRLRFLFFALVHMPVPATATLATVYNLMMAGTHTQRPAHSHRRQYQQSQQYLRPCVHAYHLRDTILPM